MVGPPDELRLMRAAGTVHSSPSLLAADRARLDQIEAHREDLSPHDEKVVAWLLGERRTNPALPDLGVSEGIESLVENPPGRVVPPGLLPATGYHDIEAIRDAAVTTARNVKREVERKLDDPHFRRGYELLRRYWHSTYIPLLPPLYLDDGPDRAPRDRESQPLRGGGIEPWEQTSPPTPR